MEKKKINIFFSLLTLIFIFHQILIFTLWNGLGERFPFSTGTYIYFIWRIGRPSCTYGKNKRCMGRREEKVRVRVRVSPNNQSVIIVSLPVLAWAVTCCWYRRENKTNYNVRWMVQTLPEKKKQWQIILYIGVWKQSPKKIQSLAFAIGIVKNSWIQSLTYWQSIYWIFLRNSPDAAGDLSMGPKREVKGLS